MSNWLDGLDYWRDRDFGDEDDSSIFDDDEQFTLDYGEFEFDSYFDDVEDDDDGDGVYALA